MPTNHGLLDRINPKGQKGVWRCRYCGDEGTIEQLEGTCTYDYPACQWCGQTPECAEDCVGIRLAFSDPDIHIAGEIP